MNKGLLSIFRMWYDMVCIVSTRFVSSFNNIFRVANIVVFSVNMLIDVQFINAVRHRYNFNVKPYMIISLFSYSFPVCNIIKFSVLFYFLIMILTFKYRRHCVTIIYRVYPIVFVLFLYFYILPGMYIWCVIIGCCVYFQRIFFSHYLQFHTRVNIFIWFRLLNLSI